MISICLSVHVDVMGEALVLFCFVSFCSLSDDEWLMVPLVALLSGWPWKSSLIHLFGRRIL